MLRLEENENYDDRKKGFFAADRRPRDDRICFALLAYAVQMATNRARFNKSCTDPVEELKQWYRRGVDGHPLSAAVLNGRFTSR